MNLCICPVTAFRYLRTQWRLHILICFRHCFSDQLCFTPRYYLCLSSYPAYFWESHWKSMRLHGIYMYRLTSRVCLPTGWHYLKWWWRSVAHRGLSWLTVYFCEVFITNNGAWHIKCHIQSYGSISLTPYKKSSDVICQIRCCVNSTPQKRISTS